MLDFITKIPPLKSGEDLIKSLTVLPEYNFESIKKQNTSERLISLNDIYQIYVPSEMSLEIYNKLYLALLRSMQKKTQDIAIKQRYENYKAIQQKSYKGIIGGSDSFTIIGTSGIGKSSAITRAISLITENSIIETKNPFAKIIPCLIVQCPFDSSVKGLLIEILRKIDEVLNTDYYTTVVKSRSTTTDMLMGIVSNLAINHIGMLIVDEIQNVVNSKNGKKLVGSLTQLINNSGISICMIGTPECLDFFTQAMQLARRSLGLQYTSLQYDDYFQSFCKIIFSYQYVLNQTEITQNIIDWLYEHSAGVTSIVISLIHDAQEISILTGKEVLNIETLNEAYNQRLSLLHDFVRCEKITKSTVKKKNNISTQQTQVQLQENKTIESIVQFCKNNHVDVLSEIRKYYPIVEVRI